MAKNFERWHEQKTWLNDRQSHALFNEREVWWCRLGANIGHEQDGIGKMFRRPVVIIKKFGLDCCTILPVTSRVKSGEFYFPIGFIESYDSFAIVSQIRFIDQKRLTNKICTLSEEIFEPLVRQTIKINLPKP